MKILDWCKTGLMVVLHFFLPAGLALLGARKSKNVPAGYVRWMWISFAIGMLAPISIPLILDSRAFNEGEVLGWFYWTFPFFYWYFSRILFNNAREEWFGKV